ncbi:hypothetical protein KC19_12G027700 [Ceratodon purpureus]|uniref:Uncharacterized protein n=1 Tax=Ceratodon purpureus TaxID=3225 RepID=A0A8T0G405_CERPU|nr:hypothetical protein KC19_12G027700 [Ceratodon purpureus]
MRSPVGMLMVDLTECFSFFWGAKWTNLTECLEKAISVAAIDNQPISNSIHDDGGRRPLRMPRDQSAENMMSLVGSVRDFSLIFSVLLVCRAGALKPSRKVTEIDAGGASTAQSFMPGDEI